MKRTIVSILCIGTVLLAARIWRQQLVAAQDGGGPNAAACRLDPTQFGIDANGDGEIDVSDAIQLLSWLFVGGGEPKICLAEKPETTMFIEQLRFGQGIAGTWVVGAPGQAPYAILTMGADGTAISADANDFTGGQEPGQTPGFHSNVRWSWRRVGERSIRVTGLFGVFHTDGSPWGTSRLSGELEFSEDFETFTGTLCERSFQAPQDPLDPEAEPFSVHGPDGVFARRLEVLDPSPCQ